MLVDAARAALVVIDIQKRLAAAIGSRAQVVGNVCRLLRAARRLSVPVLVSEQYPKGIGATVDELAGLLRPDEVFQKITFSCLGAPVFIDRFQALNRDQAVLVGMEAHVCVLQTGLELLERGSGVFVVADAVGSRDRSNAEAALARLDAAGARVVTTEMVIFEWLRRAGTPEFRDLLPIIKNNGTADWP